jgi:cytochrome c oxidase subunit IV
MEGGDFGAMCFVTAIVLIGISFAVYLHTEYGRNATLYRIIWFTMVAFIVMVLILAGVTVVR